MTTKMGAEFEQQFVYIHLIGLVRELSNENGRLQSENERLALEVARKDTHIKLCAEIEALKSTASSAMVKHGET